MSSSVAGLLLMATQAKARSLSPQRRCHLPLAIIVAILAVFLLHALFTEVQPTFSDGILRKLSEPSRSTWDHSINSRDDECHLLRLR